MQPETLQEGAERETSERNKLCTSQCYKINIKDINHIYPKISLSDEFCSTSVNHLAAHSLSRRNNEGPKVRAEDGATFSRQ